MQNFRQKIILIFLLLFNSFSVQSVNAYWMADYSHPPLVAEDYIKNAELILLVNVKSELNKDQLEMKVLEVLKGQYKEDNININGYLKMPSKSYEGTEYHIYKLETYYVLILFPKNSKLNNPFPMHWEVFGQEDDRVVWIKKYLKGGLEGSYQWHDQNGQLIREMNYKNNLLNGLVREYVSNGILQKELQFFDDKLITIEVALDSSVSSKYFYKGEILVSSEQYSSGKDGNKYKSEEMAYLDGNYFQGKAKRIKYDQTGNVLKTIDWLDGHEVKVYNSSGKLIADAVGDNYKKYNEKGQLINEKNVDEDTGNTVYKVYENEHLIKELTQNSDDKNNKETKSMKIYDLATGKVVKQTILEEYSNPDSEIIKIYGEKGELINQIIDKKDNTLTNEQYEFINEVEEEFNQFIYDDQEYLE